MTFKIPPGSAKAIVAARFGAELTRAMRARKASNVRLAAAIGGSKAAIANWKIGGNMPRLSTAQRLADALDWPKLIEIAAAGRQHPCQRCGRLFVHESGGLVRFCSTACREIDEQLRRPMPGADLAGVVRAELARIDGSTHAVSRRTLKAALAQWDRQDKRRSARIDKLERQLVGIQATVDDMCRSCEPSGLCAQPACALRPISPFPLASAIEAEPMAPAGDPWAPEHRERRLVAVRAANERRWNRPGERERMASLTAERRSAWTDQDRAEFVRRVTDGKRRAAREKAS